MSVAEFVSHRPKSVYDARTSAKNLFEDLFLVLFRREPQFSLHLLPEIWKLYAIVIVRGTSVIEYVFEYGFK